MNQWPDEALAREMMADADHMLKYAHGHSSAADCGCHIKALLSRVRELEKREAELTAALEKIAGPPDGLRDWKMLTAREALKGGRNEQVAQ